MRWLVSEGLPCQICPAPLTVGSPNRGYAERCLPAKLSGFLVTFRAGKVSKMFPLIGEATLRSEKDPRKAQSRAFVLRPELD